MVDLSGFVQIFFFNDTATTEIYTLSLHDALPIFDGDVLHRLVACLADHQLPLGDVLARAGVGDQRAARLVDVLGDRKSTRLNSSHANISYAVFCLKKKKTHHYIFMYDLYVRTDTS